MTDETKPSKREALVAEAKRLAAQLRSYAFNEGADNERPHMSDRFYEKSANKARATQDALYAAIDRLAAAPAPSAQPLTEEKIDALWDEETGRSGDMSLKRRWLRFARAVERAHGITE